MTTNGESKMSAIKITIAGKPTLAASRLVAGLAQDGTEPTRRAKGFTDFGDLMNLVQAGFMQVKPIGPKGGKRFLTTPEGQAALKNAGL